MKFKGLRNLAAALSLTSLTACAHFAMNPNYKGPEPRPAELVERFAPKYDKIEKETLKVIEKNRRFTITEDVLHVISGNDTNNIGGYFYRINDSTNAPIVLQFSPNGGGYELPKFIGRAYLGFNMESFAPKRADKIKNPGPDDVSVMIENEVRNALVVIDYLAKYEKRNKVGGNGTSRGGITLSYVVSLDDRMNAAVIMAGSGSLAKLITSTPELEKSRKQICEKGKVSRKELKEILKERIIDPNDIAKYADANKILQIIPRTDRIIKPEYQIELWERLGRSRRTDLPWGHYPSVIAIPFLIPETSIFFKMKFAEVEKKQEGYYFEFHQNFGPRMSDKEEQIVRVNNETKQKLKQQQVIPEIVRSYR